MAEKSSSGSSYAHYLELEQNPEVKYEFHDGLITAMAGGTLKHGQITSNVNRALGNSLAEQDKPCITYSSDVKVRISSTNRTFYPDLSVVCEQPETSEIDQHAITNPQLLIEVLSKNTAAFDRGAKFTHYRQLPSLREYVLISQDEIMVDTYYRTDDGTWEIESYQSIKQLVILKSLGVEVEMEEVYRLVEMED